MGPAPLERFVMIFELLLISLWTAKRMLHVALLWQLVVCMSNHVFAMEANTDESKKPQSRMIVVLGAAGTPEYGEQFETAAKQWSTLGNRAGLAVTEIGFGSSDEKSDVDLLHAAILLLEEPDAVVAQPHWLVLIGHGTFQANLAKFNLRGRDVAADQLAVWTKKISHPLVILNVASASGPFVNALSGKNRIIVTATRSGEEQDFARFGNFLPSALGDIDSDLDHDDEVSLLEAVIKAASQTGDFYRSEDRIQTEHAIVDDNGDSLGTPAEMLNLVLRGTPALAAKPAKPKVESAQLDGNMAAKTILIPSANAAVLLPEELIERARIESELTLLRAKKTSLSEADYFAKLEKSMLELAIIYETAEKREKLPANSP